MTPITGLFSNHCQIKKETNSSIKHYTTNALDIKMKTA